MGIVLSFDLNASCIITACVFLFSEVENGERNI